MMYFIIAWLWFGTAQAQELSAPPKPVQYITVEVERVEGELQAKITSLSEEAENLGLSNLKLKGVVHKEPADQGKEKAYITWSDVALDETRQSIEKPYTSKLLISGDIKEGMKFKAEGDPQTLIQAWQRLQEREETLTGIRGAVASANGTQDRYGEDVAVDGGSAATGQLNSESPEIESAGPSFDVTKDPIILTTSEGCEIKVDLDQMIAIVQQKTLEDGKEVIACSDSFTRYPITSEYSSCSVLIDIENLKAYEQKTLGYIDPETAGRIEVQGCTADEERFVAINETDEGCTDYVGESTVTKQTRLYYELKGIQTTVQECSRTDTTYDIIKSTASCSIRHDFDGGKSYQQYRQTYVKDGVTIEIASCQDNADVTFAHQVTRETCSPLVEGDSVIFQERKYITVDGKRQYINECAPNAEKTAEVVKESCASPAYTHDFDSGQSYRNVNYFYLDNSKAVVVKSCVASEETFTHYTDTGVCEDQNDDSQKHSKIYGKTFITASNSVSAPASERIYISSCKQIGTPVAYTKTGNKWKIASSVVEYLQVADGDAGKCSFDVWASVSGKEISKSNSDQNPEFPITGYSYKYLCYADRTAHAYHSCSNCNIVDGQPCTAPYGRVGNIQDTVQIGGPACSTPSCSVTTLNSHPVYQRPDGSDYYDTSTVINQTQVCGNGSKLNGKME
jgi:hypothetical protein